MRWDVVDGAPNQLVLRTHQAYERGNLILRQLYRLEPLFEHGVSIGLALVMIDGVRARAEAAPL
jgi:hypothetical protein